MYSVQKFFLRDFINNGNRAEWSPIRSVIIHMLQNWTTTKQESDLFNHEYDYRLNWTKQSPVTVTISKKIYAFLFGEIAFVHTKCPK